MRVVLSTVAVELKDVVTFENAGDRTVERQRFMRYFLLERKDRLRLSEGRQWRQRG